jgi:transcriptional regulator with XRE-family HTH domain
MPPRRRRYYTECTAIEKMRISAGWTQEELARMAKISVRTLQRIEGRETDNPSIRPLLNIAAILGCELEDVIEQSWGDFQD